MVKNGTEQKKKNTRHVSIIGLDVIGKCGVTDHEIQVYLYVTTQHAIFKISVNNKKWFVNHQVVKNCVELRGE